jgi:DNA-binding response OmpR family regulator
MVAHFGPFTLDVARRRVSRGPTAIYLTPTVFDLLRLLVEEAPRVE